MNVSHLNREVLAECAVAALSSLETKAASFATTESARDSHPSKSDPPPKTWRVLWADDTSWEDSAVEEQLAFLEVPFLLQRVRSSAEFQDALAGEWDFILSEYSLGREAMLDALRSTLLCYPETPVVLLTEELSEQDAIEATRAGISDYILKRDLSRLGNVLIRELQQAEQRRDAHSTEQALREATAILRATQKASGEGICLVSNDGKVVSFNQAFVQLWNLSAQEADTLCAQEQLLYHVLSQLNDPDEWVEKMHYFFDNPNDSTHDEVLLNDGRMLERYSTPALSPDDECFGRVWSFKDVSAHKKYERQLAHQAFHDPVTSLPNRALFLDRLGRTVARVRRSTRTAAVLFLDLDRFKVINDSLGHAVGDQLLLEVASRLQSCLRPGDTAARFGGDEFTILLEDIASIQDAILVAERVLHAISAPFQLGTQEVHVSTSIGIVTAGRDADSADDLLRKADVAMYRAKHKGRAQYAVFDTRMSAQALERLQLEVDLRRAIKMRQLQIHFQPVIDLQRGRIMGTEALARWYHPKRGLVAPSEFVALAEEIGMIRPIGEWVLREACAWTHAWQEQFAVENGAQNGTGSTPLGRVQIGSSGMVTNIAAAKSSYTDITISVNLSAKQFQQPNLTQTIAQILQETNLSPRSLIIEITESAVMDDVHSAVAQLEALKKLGIGLSVDDFGTGYSSLSYLERFPLDALKVDRAFVSRIGERGERLAIVHAICNLAHALGLRVTAEGLETGWQVAQLRRIGCKAGQGYYFSRPLPGDDMTRLLERHPQW